MELRLVVLEILFRDIQMYRSFGVNNSQTYSHKLNLKQFNTLGEWLFIVLIVGVMDMSYILNSEIQNWLGFC